MLDIFALMVYYIGVGKRASHMEQYRSGHNGHDWKSCVVVADFLQVCLFFLPCFLPFRIYNAKIPLPESSRERDFASYHFLGSV